MYAGKVETAYAFQTKQLLFIDFSISSMPLSPFTFFEIRKHGYNKEYVAYYKQQGTAVDIGMLKSDLKKSKLFQCIIAKPNSIFICP